MKKVNSVDISSVVWNEAMQRLQGYIVGYLIRHKIDTKGSSIWVKQMEGKSFCMFWWFPKKIPVLFVISPTNFKEIFSKTDEN